MRPPDARKPKFARPLAEFVGGALDPLAAKRGFGESDVLLHWDAIVGERLAQVCEPSRLQWPPRAPKAGPDAPAEPATLHVRVEGAFALEVQHLAPIIRERVNARLGWRCVDRIVLKQGPLEKRAAVPVPVAPPGEADLARAATLTAAVDDGDLRESLTRLGARIVQAGETGRA